MHKQLVAPDRLSVWFSAQRLKALLSVGLRHFLFATLLGSFALTGLFFSMQALGQGWQTAQPFEGIAFALMSGDRSRLNSPGGGCGSLDGGTVSGSESGGPSTDLEVTKFVDNPTPREGDTIVYTIFLANLGPDDATRVRVRDVLPAGVTYVGDIPSRGDYNPDNGLWSLNNLVYCDSATLTISATVNNGTAGEIITNTASYVSADPPDPNPGNNVGEAVIKVQLPAGADLAITKTVNISHPNAGDTITYTVTVINNGPDDATGVEISDKLPLGVTYISTHTVSYGQYDSGSGIWAISILPGRTKAELTINAIVDNCTNGKTITNTAIISTTDQSSTLENNEASAKITVTSATPCHVYLPVIFKRPFICSPVDTFTSREGASNKWPKEVSPYIMDYKNFKYQIRTGDPTKIHIAPLLDKRFSEYYYYIKTEVNWFGGNNSGARYGLIFAFVPQDDTWKQAYRFLVDNSKGYYYLDRSPNTKDPKRSWYTITSGNASQYLNSGLLTNTLEVRHFFDEISLYINEQLITTTHDISYIPLSQPIQVGLGVYPPDKVSVDARFDNFVYCYSLIQTTNTNIKAFSSLEGSSFIIPKD